MTQDVNVVESPGSSTETRDCPPAKAVSSLWFSAAFVLFAGCQDSAQSVPEVAGNWCLMKPVTSPPAQCGAVMVYHPVRERILMIGGIGEELYTSNVWEWDGQDWTKIKTTGGPGGTQPVSAAYDKSRQSVLAFDGATLWELRESDEDATSDVWGLTWCELGSGPPARYRAGTAYSGLTFGVVMFGGAQGEGDEAHSLADTWKWDEDKWVRLPTTQTGGRSGHSMVSAGPGLFVFGGRREGTIGEAYLDDGLMYVMSSPVSDGDWRESPARLPVGLTDFGAAYDSDRGRIVAFGGAGRKITVCVFGETFECDGLCWARARCSSHPSPRQSPAMAYDVRRKKIVLFGGEGASGRLDDTWEYDGSPTNGSGFHHAFRGAPP